MEKLSKNGVLSKIDLFGGVLITQVVNGLSPMEIWDSRS